MPQRYTTPQIIDALHRRYRQNDGRWANIVEFQAIDFLAVATGMAKGFAVHGHEIKASRSDWLRELKKPGKSLFSMARCDYWWLAAPKGVAKAEEIPHGWGFMELGMDGFKVVLRAPRLTPAFDKRRVVPGVGPNPDFFNRENFAMMARRFAYAQADCDALLEAVDEPKPYLDIAASATGRTYSGTANKFATMKRRAAKADRDRIHDILMKRVEDDE